MGSLQSSTGRELGTVIGYRGEDLDIFLSNARAEKESLEAAVAGARSEQAALEEQLASATELRNRLGELVLEAQREAQVRRAEVDESIAEIVGAAEAEAERVLIQARREAAALRAGVMPAQVNGHVGEVG